MRQLTSLYVITNCVIKYTTYYNGCGSYGNGTQVLTGNKVYPPHVKYKDEYIRKNKTCTFKVYVKI